MKKLLRLSIVSVGFSVMVSAQLVGSERDRLRQVLKDEAAGQAVDRRDGIDPANIESAKIDQQTAWQAGLVRVADQWQRFEDFEPSPLDKEYEVKRAENWGKADGHLIMARWCQKNKLSDRARSHYFSVIAVDPNHFEARDSLGHVAIDGQWIDGKELEKTRQAMRDSFRQLETWTPRLAKLLGDIRSGQTKKMIAALEELEQIDAAEALPALTAFAVRIDDDLAKPLVHKITGLRSREACQSLVQIALVHPSAAIQSQAAKSIQTYPSHYYVPDLLAMLSGETNYVDTLVTHPNGTVSMESLVITELKDKTVARKLNSLVNVIGTFQSSRSATVQDYDISDVYRWSIRFRIPRKAPRYMGEQVRSSTASQLKLESSFTYVPDDVFANATASLREKSQQNARATAEQNRAIKQQVNQVCTLLRATTGETIGDDAQRWWQWWNEINERYEGTKPLDFAASTQYGQINVSTSNESSDIIEGTYRNYGKELQQFSCLVPGTLVQTSTGLVPIEQIKVGDLVLSQDVETAELDYKPVLLTTVRPPKLTTTIVTANDTIEATGGHNWWVSGSGWTATSSLQPGMLLHTATGAVAIEKLVENPDKQETFNLVVDEFNTYFVGPNRVLSYDNSQLRPSLRKLPGYDEPLGVQDRVR